MTTQADINELIASIPGDQSELDELRRKRQKEQAEAFRHAVLHRDSGVFS